MKNIYRNSNVSRLFLLLVFLAFMLFSCTKLISISPPTSTITTQEVFADSADATAALLGVYSSLGSTGTSLNLTNGGISIYTGSSSDELIDFNQIALNYLYINQILSNNSAIEQYYWTPAFKMIYNANACIEGVQGSSGIQQATKNQIVGEAKFIRALIDFYLVNLFGDVPLINTSSYQTNSLLPKSSSTAVYSSIESDLHDADNLLPADYSVSNGSRIRVNKWAAEALLARVYLYTAKFDSAEIESTNVINTSSLFGLETNLNNVFLCQSKEAILQWNLNTSIFPYNATAEGYSIIPSAGYNPFYYLSTQLLSAFEPGDSRRSSWVDSISYSGKPYFIPYKYKIGSAKAQANASPTEYYMVLRLAEQYLIRAEARVQQGTNLSGATDDINKIRNRAGLSSIPYGLSTNELLSRIAQERRIELFAEWGHRWFDLKRTGKIDSVMSLTTPFKIGGSAWQSYQQLYPIPLSELSLNPNLIQNQGY